MLSYIIDILLLMSIINWFVYFFFPYNKHKNPKITNLKSLSSIKYIENFDNEKCPICLSGNINKLNNVQINCGHKLIN